MNRAGKRRLSTPAARGRASRAMGFTLLELLVAVTLMSVLALMSWRALDALIDARERISRSGDDLRALVVAFAQIEEDLRRAWPVRLLDVGRPAVLVAGVADGRDIPGAGRLDLIREAPAVAAMAGAGTRMGAGEVATSGLQRVVWRLEGGRLERGFSPWWPGAPDSTADSGAERDAAAGSMVWQTLLERVDLIGWRVQIPGSGWQGAGQRVDASTPTASGVEVSLLRSGERLVRIFSVRD